MVFSPHTKGTVCGCILARLAVTVMSACVGVKTPCHTRKYTQLLFAYQTVIRPEGKQETKNHGHRKLTLAADGSRCLSVQGSSLLLTALSELTASRDCELRACQPRVLSRHRNHLPRRGPLAMPRVMSPSKTGTFF